MSTITPSDPTPHPASPYPHVRPAKPTGPPTGRRISLNRLPSNGSSAQQRGSASGGVLPECVACRASIGLQGKRRKGYCGSCVRAGLDSHAEATRILTAQLLATRTRSHAILIGSTGNGAAHVPSNRMVSSRRPSFRAATTSTAHPLIPIAPSRGILSDIRLLASHASLTRTNVAARAEIELIWGKNEGKRVGLRGRRDEVLRRRANLVLGRGKIISPLPPTDFAPGMSASSRTSGRGGSYLEDTPHALLAGTRADNLDFQTRLTRARQVLVQEVIEVLGIRRRSIRAGGFVKSPSDALGKRLEGRSEDARRVGGIVDGIGLGWEIAGLHFLFPRDAGGSFPGESNSAVSKTSSLSRHPSASKSLDPTATSTRTLNIKSKRSSEQTLPPHYDNAILAHTVHALNVIVSYLDVSLPFEMTWREGTTTGNGLVAAFAAAGATTDRDVAPQPHVGKIHLSTKNTLPFLRSVPLSSRDTEKADHGAGRSRENLEEALWRKEGVLYVSTGRARWRKRLKANGSGTGTTSHDVTPVGSVGRAGSTVLVAVEDGASPGSDLKTKSTAVPTASTLTFGGRDKHQEKEDQLILAYTMLVMNVAYLAHTQGVDLGAADRRRSVISSAGSRDGDIEGTVGARQVKEGEKQREKEAAHAMEDLGSLLKYIAALGNSADLGRASHLPSAARIRSIALPVNFAALHTQMSRAFAGLAVFEGENDDGDRHPRGSEAAGEDEEWDVL